MAVVLIHRTAKKLMRQTSCRRAGKPRARAPAGPPKGQRWVLLILNLEQRVQHHGPAAANTKVSCWRILCQRHPCAQRHIHRAGEAGQPLPVQVDLITLVCRLLPQVRVPPARHNPWRSAPAAAHEGLQGARTQPGSCRYIANSRISGVFVAALSAAACAAGACSAVVVVMRAAAGASRGSRLAPLRSCPSDCMPTL